VDDTVWIRSKATRELLRQHRPDWQRPEWMLRPGLVNGLLTARARTANLTPRNSRGRKNQESDWLVPKEAWIGSAENSVFNLGSDTFSTRAHGTGYDVVELIGLSFNEAELLDFAEINPASVASIGPPHNTSSHSQAERPNRRGGRPPNRKDWTRFAVSLALWVHKRDDEASGIAETTPEALLEELDQIAMNELPELQQGSLPRSTYQDAVAAVLEAFSHHAGN
jgi:hypothetical protein